MKWSWLGLKDTLNSSLIYCTLDDDPAAPVPNRRRVHTSLCLLRLIFPGRPSADPPLGSILFCLLEKRSVHVLIQMWVRSFPGCVHLDVGWPSVSFKITCHSISAPDGLPPAFNRPFGKGLYTNSTGNEVQLIGIKGHVEFLVDLHHVWWRSGSTSHQSSTCSHFSLFVLNSMKRKDLDYMVRPLLW